MFIGDSYPTIRSTWTNNDKKIKVRAILFSPSYCINAEAVDVGSDLRVIGLVVDFQVVTADKVKGAHHLF